MALINAALGVIESPGVALPVGQYPSTKYCLINAAAPAVVGHDILVPLIDTTPQLCELIFPSESADHILTPGAQTLGFILPSSVGPWLLKYAMFSASAPFSVAPTLTTFFADAGEPTVLLPGPEFPFENSIKKSL